MAFLQLHSLLYGWASVVVPQHAADCKLLALCLLLCSGLPDSSVVKGMVLRRDTEGTVKSVKDAKVAVFAQVRAASDRV